MKRFLVMLAVMALLVVALTAPAFAAASPDANCVGFQVSKDNQEGREGGVPGFGSGFVSAEAKDGGIGAQGSSNCT
jgi:hypothetical protein